ncbi:MAG: hypothetical protein KBT27_09310 [Prevotellaceae bacterium]|nr:hypothetical protein [Candidatus Faecinaster equi]
MTICKCDRCGMVYDKNALIVKPGSLQQSFVLTSTIPNGVVITTNNGADLSYDLCDHCLKAFEAFMAKELFKTEEKRK